jgi:3-dehydroquinate dehydratase/shikimate dehydrogenase
MNSAATTLSQHYLRSRIGKLCVAIIGSTAEEMIDRATEAMRDSPFLEFRLDYLEKPVAALPKLKQFLSENAVATAIATCRREANGGKFNGAIAAELDVLEKATASGFHLIDLELQTAEAIKSTELEKLRTRGAALIVSWHDFQTTKDLDGIFERIRPYEPEFIKIVCTARSLADNVVMMHFLERSGDMANMVGLCMGDQGVISRVLAIRAGSVFTFAAAAQGEETAPGQIDARTLTDVYRP